MNQQVSSKSEEARAEQRIPEKSLRHIFDSSTEEESVKAAAEAAAEGESPLTVPVAFDRGSYVSQSSDGSLARFSVLNIDLEVIST